MPRIVPALAGTLTPSNDLLLVDGDIAEPATAEKLIRSAEQRFGTAHILINNAGIFVPTPVRHMERNGGGSEANAPDTAARHGAEVVDAALVSVRAPFITGEVLYVNGGAHAWQMVDDRPGNECGATGSRVPTRLPKTLGDSHALRNDNWIVRG